MDNLTCQFLACYTTWMSPTDIVVRYSKELEFILERDFGAQGKGLHQKVSSVEHLLPVRLVKTLRFLASVRNKVIHDYTYVLDKNPRDLQKTARLAVSELKRIAKQQRNPGAKIFSFFLFVIVCLLIVLGYLYFR
jgi:hypothetical protein